MTASGDSFGGHHLQIRGEGGKEEGGVRRVRVELGWSERGRGLWMGEKERVRVRKRG